ncbi:zinc finger protein ZAT5 [Primulina huaijiensis]|uniref:zinc finger protein ZAT5 n=1 Tax=Primulina huaijiensis TaxID=1492673 RepID=UPI003CC70CEA
MMNMEIMEEFAGSSDQIVVKGKRTKRPRPSYSTTSSGGDGGGGEIWSTVSSPTTSSGISTSTEEDEDMANCLILLARGGFPPGEMAAPEKFVSRKFTEMSATANGSKVGIFVYECKTCSRTFPSFQALGGHRASHKKPKSAAENDRKKPLPADDDQEEEEGKFAGLNHIIAPPTSSELMNHKTLQLGNKPKIHECSICGSEFASGQALGGHMRRHRSATNTAQPPDVSEKPRKNVLALDLNLPAPPEDDHRETNLNQFPANQQRRLVLSAATLVDCHY